MYETMKTLILFYCLLSVTLAAREKKVNLEDIENENLASERQSHQHKPLYEQQQQHHRGLQNRYVSPPRSSPSPSPPPSPPNMEYGFRPVKAQSQVPQQQSHLFAQNPQHLIPQQQYDLQQYFAYQPVEQQQVQYQQVQTQQQPVQVAKPQPKFQYEQVQAQQAQHDQIQQQIHIQQQQEQIHKQSYLQQLQQAQAQAHQAQAQAQAHQAQPHAQAQQPQAQFKFQEFDLPYTQNYQLVPEHLLQQYYTPQVAYVQPQPSTNQIHAIASPKGGVEYVMYIPQQYLQEAKSEPTQTVPTVHQAQQYVPTSREAGPPIRPQIQYIEVPVPHHYRPQEAQSQPTLQQFEVERVPDYDYMTKKYNPKSLIDSYVPSVLQLQYMKQHNQKAQLEEVPTLKGKKKEQTGFLKNVFADFLNAAQNINYRYLTPPPRQQPSVRQPARH